MSESEIVRYCAPTLAGLKTASLFNTACDSYEKLIREIRQANRILRKRGMKLIPLSFAKKRALIYVYRESSLAADLKNEMSRKILQQLGYVNKDIASCISTLSSRIRNEQEFPHEIGLFLGYPPYDVDCFMKGRNDYVACGMWKAYSDAQKANETFAMFDQCTKNYTKRLEQGESLEKLAVKSAVMKRR